MRALSLSTACGCLGVKSKTFMLTYSKNILNTFMLSYFKNSLNTLLSNYTSLPNISTLGTLNLYIMLLHTTCYQFASIYIYVSGVVGSIEQIV